MVRGYVRQPLAPAPSDVIVDESEAGAAAAEQTAQEGALLPPLMGEPALGHIRGRASPPTGLVV
jgi:hypothetical protein